MKIENIIQLLRKTGWLLDLTSTVLGADAKYSAAFVPSKYDECGDCGQAVRPNGWEDYAHADTVEEAVRAAVDLHYGVEQ